MLYLSTTQGVFRVNLHTGIVARLGPLDTSVEALAVVPSTGSGSPTIVAAITPNYGLPMRRPLRPASHAGAVRSTDGGVTWSAIPGLAGQQVTALASHSSLLVAGIDPAALATSRDCGFTWLQSQSLTALPGYQAWTYPLPPHTPHVMLVAPHPTREGTLFAGIEVGGILRSDDSGATWRVVGAGDGRRNAAGAVHPDIHGLAICPATPDCMYASTPEGVYWSADGGESWEHRIQGLDPLYCRPIAVHQRDPNVAIVVATHGASGFFGISAERTGGTVLRTEDAGRTWHPAVAGLPQPLAPTPALAADPAQPGRFYLPLFSGEVYLTEDAGTMWRELAGGLPPILRLAIA